MSDDSRMKDDPKYRAKVARTSGIAGIASNVFLFILKLVTGTLSGSLSITADAMNNLSDATSSIVTMIGFRLAEVPSDERHPYGHARFEYLSGLAVAAIMLVIGFELFQHSFVRIFRPSPIEFSFWVVIVLVGSMIVKIWLYFFNRRLSRSIDSQALMATAQDSRNDVFSTAAVLVAGIVETSTGYRIDGFMGLAVAIFIIISSIRMGIETISPLLGENGNPELCRSIATIIRSCPKVLSFHDMMVHDYGPGQRFATLHVEMDRCLDPLDCHEAIDELEREVFRELNVHLTIHYDPVVIGDPESDKLREDLTLVLKSYDERLGMHDFRHVKAKGFINLIFDVTLPSDLKGRETEIRHYVESMMAERGHGRVYAVITFDPGVFNSYDKLK